MRPHGTDPQEPPPPRTRRLAFTVMACELLREDPASEKRDPEPRYFRPSAVLKT